MSVVYFIQAGPGGPIKIGVSVNLPRRLEQLRCGHSVALAVLATVPGSYPEETRLHRRFRTLRMSGEWFQSAPELLDFIAEIKAAPDSLVARIDADEKRADEEARARAEHICDELYELIGRCIEEYGGIDAFAARVGTTPRDVYQRLHREAVGGHRRQFFLDWIAYLCVKPRVAATFLVGMCDIFGYGRPRLLESLRRAAAEAGADVSEFDE